jgi:[ribosomal protein S18]-alanine N-acetyltransferase
VLDRNVVAHRATIGRNFAGFVISRVALDEAEILSVAVAQAYRGRAVARALLRYHLGRLAALGVRTVFLEVDEGNVSALRLYQRAGFVQVGRREGYYLNAAGKPAAALVLRRNLV